MRPEDFNLADIKTLIGHAQALAAPEPEPFHQVRPNSADNKAWQEDRDKKTAALAYVATLAPVEELS